MIISHFIVTSLPLLHTYRHKYLIKENLLKVFPLYHVISYNWFILTINKDKLWLIEISVNNCDHNFGIIKKTRLKILPIDLKTSLICNQWAQKIFATCWGWSAVKDDIYHWSLTVAKTARYCRRFIFSWLNDRASFLRRLYGRLQYF